MSSFLKYSSETSVVVLFCMSQPFSKFPPGISGGMFFLTRREALRFAFACCCHRSNRSRAWAIAIVLESVCGVGAGALVSIPLVDLRDDLVQLSEPLPDALLRR